MLDADFILRKLFSGLASFVITGIEDADDMIVVRARTGDDPVPCPDCGTPTSLVHEFHERAPADVPVDGRPVTVRVRVRRLRCRAQDCPRTTFREQVPGVLERYQRHTVRLTHQLQAVVLELAGRASIRVLAAAGITAGKDTAIRALLRIPLPNRPVPAVLGFDDFALRRSHEYATIVINADTGQRIEVLPGRGGQAVTEWLRANPDVTTVCRDGSATYAQAVRDALPDALQVADRWHLWHGLAEAAGKEIAAHSACWASATGLQDGPRAATTANRWKQVHDLLDHGVGLLDCSRRLNLSLNTVKRYARATEPERLQRVPQYRPTLVDPYRDHLRARREQDPAVTPTQLLAEIRGQGYPGSMNLLVRYLNQGRHLDEQVHLSPRRATRLMLTRPDRLTPGQQTRVTQIAGACPQTAAVHQLVGSFAALLTPADGNEARLEAWMRSARAADLPHLNSFARGLQQDHAAVTAAVTTHHHNGRTEGVNTRTKMLKRQMYGRASFELLRHRILLA